ncbi:MAG: DUF262 domain-containing protein [Treponemataceae bacterium]|nr:MAG: DUF262 domain-containing protein [Treponemataceae bacterium]
MRDVIKLEMVRQAASMQPYRNILQDKEKPNMIERSSIWTFKDLFKNRNNIRIPVYQRAYSWGRKEYGQFFDDLIEQNGKPYHFGLFIFEYGKNGVYFVIDGQQRLTTAVLFLAALAKTKAVKNENIDDICETYLSGSFSTVDDDDEYFKRLIKYFSCGDKKANTISQGKIKEAFDFFSEKLEKIKTNETENLRQSMENAKIGIFDIDNKSEASQIFEYQNNRGVPASDFEIIKAYLIHQVYVNSGAAEADITKIQKSISKIYRNLESISEHFSEDDILWCWFYLYEYTQNVEYNIDGIKYCLSPENKDKPVKDICEWVKVFFKNFEKITDAANTLVSKTSPQIANLFLIGNKPYWPVIMLAVIMKEVKPDNERLNRLAKLFEILWFKYEYCNRRIDSLPEWAYNYFNESAEDKLSFGDLCQRIEEAIDSGFDGRFPEFKKAVQNYLGEDDQFKFKSATRYVLWQYENFLREEANLPKLVKKNYHKYNTIEHIQPRDTGLSYIHKLGNLSLLSQPDNSKASDKNFEYKKQEVYSKYFNKYQTKLLQYRDILSKDLWREQEVNERFGKIKEFMKEYLSAS